jgi:hypothetical protein
LTEPLWLECAGLDGVPSAKELSTSTAEGQHVVLKVLGVSRQECDALQANLSAALPDHSVFLSGGSSTYLQVTVMRAVSRQLILGSKTAIAAAMRLYRAECERLTALRQAGRLPADWTEYEHGGHCRFENQKTGQIVEASINPGVHELDPYFFAEFVSSTPQCSTVARLLTHPYHDAARMLDILTDSGSS